MRGPDCNCKGPDHYLLLLPNSSDGVERGELPPHLVGLRVVLGGQLVGDCHPTADHSTVEHGTGVTDDVGHLLTYIVSTEMAPS